MHFAIFNSHPFDRRFPTQANSATRHPLNFIEARLDEDMAPPATGAQAACASVNDRLDEAALRAPHDLGVGLVARRCAGFNNLDLKARRSGRGE